MARRDEMLSLDALQDLAAMAEIIGQVALERRPEVLEDDETTWRLEQAVECSKAREHVQGRSRGECAPPARRTSERHDLMHQQWWGVQPDAAQAARPREWPRRRRGAVGCRRSAYGPLGR
jgi:hypothetical protein